MEVATASSRHPHRLLTISGLPSSCTQLPHTDCPSVRCTGCRRVPVIFSTPRPTHSPSPLPTPCEGNPSPRVLSSVLPVPYRHVTPIAVPTPRPRPPWWGSWWGLWTTTPYWTTWIWTSKRCREALTAMWRRWSSMSWAWMEAWTSISLKTITTQGYTSRHQAPRSCSKASVPSNRQYPTLPLCRQGPLGCTSPQRGPRPGEEEATCSSHVVSCTPESWYEERKQIITVN